MQRLRLVLFAAVCVSVTLPAHAGAQREEPLADGVRTLLRQAVMMPNLGVQPTAWREGADEWNDMRWQAQMQPRLQPFIADTRVHAPFLRMVRYEANRAGLEPALVLAVIEVESRFNPQAVSRAQARGLMQVMPFWTRSIGNGQVRQLNDPHINIRYGCVILRHYLDREQGDLVRALARYNGSLGKTDYALRVLRRVPYWR